MEENMKDILIKIEQLEERINAIEKKEDKLETGKIRASLLERYDRKTLYNNCPHMFPEFKPQ